MVSLVLPTYNEEKNIELLIPLIRHYLKHIPYEIIVVDDNSTDQTVEIAEHYYELGYPIRIIVRKNERGLASATLRGFKAAKYDVVGVMDSDLQHNPKYLVRMVKEIENGADMVIGSRFASGSSFKSFPLYRKLLSLSALMLTRWLIPVNDPLGQFYLVRKSVLKGIEFDKIGFRLSMEIIVKGKPKNIVEVPIRFKQRFAGESKLRLSTAITDLKLLWRLYKWKLRNF